MTTLLTADLDGKTILVTGGASGIGLATARCFAACGAAVAVNDLPGNPRLDEAVASLRDTGAHAVAAPGDVGDPAAARAMVTAAAEQLGRLDYLVNNAATSGTDRPIPPADLDALTEDFWQRLLSANLVGPFRCTHAAAPYLRAARGAVVNTASSAAFGYPGSSAVYGATKAALVNLTLSLARGLGPEVRVNAVAPGYIRTPWTERFGSEWEALTVERTALGRAGTPDDVAEVMLFLCAGASYVTGQTIGVNGGL